VLLLLLLLLLPSPNPSPRPRPLALWASSAAAHSSARCRLAALRISLRSALLRRLAAAIRSIRAMISSSSTAAGRLARAPAGPLLSPLLLLLLLPLRLLLLPPLPLLAAVVLLEAWRWLALNMWYTSATSSPARRPKSTSTPKSGPLCADKDSWYLPPRHTGFTPFQHEERA
jgi:hypothetical protein